MASTITGTKIFLVIQVGDSIQNFLGLWKPQFLTDQFPHNANENIDREDQNEPEFARIGGETIAPPPSSTIWAFNFIL